MKRTTYSLLFCLLFLFPLFLNAASPHLEVPRYLQLQAVLVDDGGNVLYNRMDATITFWILDGAGNILYEEEQYVLMVHGTMAVLIGDGVKPGTTEKTGGLPSEIFKPEGSRMVRYKLNDQSIPQEDFILVSVPYANYAEYALNIAPDSPIDSSEILDASIGLNDLSPDLVNYITNSAQGVSEQDLLDHKAERNAHEAKNISVENSFKHLSGSNLQMVLDMVDNAIELKQLQDGVIEGSVSAEATARQQADTAHATTEIATAHAGQLPTTRLSGEITNAQITRDAVTTDKIAVGAVESTDIKDGTIIVDDLLINSFSTWDNDKSDDLTTVTNLSGDVSGKYNQLQLGSKVVDNGKLDDNAVNSIKIADDTIVPDDLKLTSSPVGQRGNNFDNWDKNAGDDLSIIGVIAGVSGAIDGPNGDIDSFTPENTNTIRLTINNNAVTGAKLNFDYDDIPIPGSDPVGYSSIDDRYVNVSGDTMTGNLNMGANNITNVEMVDGVDVSAKVQSLNSVVSSLVDKVFNQAQINAEIIANPNPDISADFSQILENPLNHEKRIKKLEAEVPRVLAWARVDVHGDGWPTRISSHNVSSVKRCSYQGGNRENDDVDGVAAECPVAIGNFTACHFILHFTHTDSIDARPSSANSYTVAANMVDTNFTNDFIIKIYQFDRDDVIIAIRNPGDNSGICPNSRVLPNFSIIVTGN